MCSLAPLRVALMVIFALLWAAPAFSGAWPRGDGDVFLSFHTSQDTDKLDTYPLVSLYAEYGLTAAWTIGGKVEYDTQNLVFSQGEVFARWHFPSNNSPYAKALSLTVSGLEGENLHLVPAFHIGRGFDTKLGGGWFDAKLNADIPVSEGATGYGLFAQVGLKPTDRLMTMLSIDVFTDDSETFAKIMPAVAWQLRKGHHVHLEWMQTVTPVQNSKISLGYWLEF